MKGYKAFNKGYLCEDFQYEIGKTYELEGELKMCKNGFHFCKNLIDVFGYYTFDKEKVVLAEVEALGKIEQEGTKFCTDKIKIVRAVEWSEVDELIKDGNFNSGHFNSGCRNSGDFNSGDFNSGDFNSGDFNNGNCNSGHHNSGHHNSGDFNSGCRNSGDYNSGNRNSGNRNSGYYNSGHYNSGDYNSGNRNSGCRNSGHHNSGYYNNGNFNSGFFNSTEPTVRLFNKQTDMTFRQFFNLGIDLLNLENSKETIKGLPGYDAQIFYEATGIDWRAEE